MKKHFTKLLCGLLLLITATVANAQTNIANYQFTKTTGATYTPITGGTVLFTSSYDDDVSTALSLGGNFIFGGVTVTQCYVNSNGYITFGAAPSSSSYTPLSTLGTTTGAISAFGQDAGASTVSGATPEISYLNIGGATGEFVVQYKDHANYYNKAQERLNFQIRLNLSTNAINIVYGPCTNPGTTSTSGTTPQVGIRGNSVTWAVNVNNLMIGNVPAGTNCTWADAVTGNANSSTMLFSGTTNVNVNIPTGLTYTWTPAISPAPVRTFYTPSGITTTTATIKWAPAVGATQYNVQYRALGSCSWTNSTPVTDTSVTITGLAVATTYQVRVQTVGAGGNAIWSHIPSSTAGSGTNGYIASGTFTTTATCSVPTTVTLNSTTTTSASINFTSTGSSFIIEYGATGFTPGTGAAAGTGGTIVTGTTSPVTITGLTPGTAYDVYIRQNCTGSGNGFSNNSIKVTLTTNCAAVTVPYTENFDAVTAPATPTCIIIEDVNGANTWATSATTFTGSSSPNVMRYSYNFTTAADDWFFVKGLTLTAGIAYQLSFKYAGTSFAEKLEVRVGTSSNSTSALAGPQIFNNTNITTVGDGSGTFTPTTSGVYYFGFHIYSIANQNALYIDDINIDVAPACPVPSAVIIGALTSTSASVSFTSTGSSFIVEYGATGFTPGTGATAGTGGTIITGTSSPVSITGLTPSTTYQVYVRQNCTAAGNGYSTNSSVVSFTTPVPPPANDNATGAITLTVGAGCTGAPYTNVGATFSTGEPYPSCSGTANAPVWFKFVAPASGAVRVSTDLGTAPTFTDSKVGLFSATDPANYATFSIISCDDDGGSAIGSGFLSVLYATGLTAGTTYYIAVDKYSSFTSAGTFCIAVNELNTAMLSTTNTCAGPTYQSPGGSNTTYTGWVPLLDSTSNLIALVHNPAGGSVSAYSASQNVNTGAVRQSNRTSYLDRNYRISNTSATNVNVQLFFLNTELAALAAVDGSVTLTNLGVSRQSNGTSSTCYNNVDLSAGALSFIPQTGSGTANGVNWISFTTPAFSNFYLHRAGTALPITLQYLKGLRTGTGNALNWKVNCTSVSITMELERSADSRSFKAITSITAPQARCGQPFDYVDATPLKGTNYYRLKMIDVDGSVSYSPIVAILNGSTGAELVGIYPTLVQDEAFLSVAASRSAKMQISITDMSGKLIRSISQTVANGSSLVSINTASLAAGVYNITGMLDGMQTKTLRFVKQ